MRVSRINNFFKSFASFHIKARIPLLILFIVFVSYCFTGLLKLKISSNKEKWSNESFYEAELKSRFRDKFDLGSGIFILVKAPCVFDYQVLYSIKRLETLLMMEVPYVKSVDSLTSVSFPYMDKSKLIVDNPLRLEIPKDKEELSRIRDFMLSKQSLVSTFFSRDLTEAFILVNFKAYDSTNDEICTNISNKAHEVLKRDEFRTDRFTMIAVGDPYSFSEVKTAFATSIPKCLRLGLALMIVILAILMKSASGIIYPVIASLCGIIIPFGLSGHLGITCDGTLVVLPLMLGLALSIGYSLHYISAFNNHYRKTGVRFDAIRDTISETAWPLLFTVLTTVVSFISFLIAHIKVVRWVGLMCACTVFSVFLSVFILIPIFLSFVSDKASVYKTEGEKLTKTDMVISRLGSAVISRVSLVSALSFGVSLVMLFGLLHMRVNYSEKDIFGKKFDFIKNNDIVESSQIGNLYGYEIMITFPEKDVLLKSSVLKRIDQFIGKVGTTTSIKKCNGKPRALSVILMIKELNRCLNNDDGEYFCIPDNDEDLSYIMKSYMDKGQEALLAWIDRDYRSMHITVPIAIDNSVECVRDFNNIKEFAKKYLPDAHVCLLGDYVAEAYLSSNLIKEEGHTFALAFLLVFIMMMIAFGGIKIGFITMIPNLFPLLVVAGFSGFLDFPLDMYSMTIMPMLLGIAVDDTIHFVNHIKMHFEQGSSYKVSIINAFSEVGKTMLFTTVILCALFLMFIFNQTQCIVRIGILSLVGLISALISDYTLTPVLIRYTKPWGKEKSK